MPCANENPAGVNPRDRRGRCGTWHGAVIELPEVKHAGVGKARGSAGGEGEQQTSVGGEHALVNAPAVVGGVAEESGAGGFEALEGYGPSGIDGSSEGT